MEWKSWFEKRILDRGKEYSRSGLVEELEISDNEIKALVIGNDEYEVSISVRNGEIEDMDCTCPYADEGFYCKHEAAALYAYEALPKDSSAPKARSLSAEELVNNADEKAVREFLINALKKDKKLLDSFKLEVSSSSDEISISSYKKRIDSIISKYTDRHGYIDYYAAGDFIDAALDFVYDELYKLTEKGYIKEAFELSTYLFKEVSDVDIDDSDGGLSTFGSELRDLWHDLSDKADENTAKEMYEWFASHLNGWVIDYMEEYLEDAIYECFESEDILNKKLALADSRIKAASSDWEKKKWILHRITVMRQIGVPENEFVSYCRKFYDDADIRRELVNYYVDTGKTEDAIDVLDDSLKNYNNNQFDTRENHALIKDLYKKLGNKEKYMEHLWVLVTEHCCLDYFRELKAQYSSDEWQEVKAKIFQANSSYMLMQLYYEEKLYDRLMTELEKEGNTFYIKEYEDVLIKLYPKRILKLYKEELNRNARQASKRSTYTYWAAELRHMLTIEGGYEVVSEILADWRVRYKNRPAMMQELDSVRI